MIRLTMIPKEQKEFNSKKDITSFTTLIFH